MRNKIPFLRKTVIEVVTVVRSLLEKESLDKKIFNYVYHDGEKLVKRERVIEQTI